MKLKACGVITIYLTLSMLVTLSLICTAAESAREAYIRARADSLTFMGADSLFSQFAEPVFKDYGVMMIWSSPERMNSDFAEYVRENTVCKDLTNLSLVRSTVTGSITPADDGGKVFADQVFEYMKYFAAEDLAERLAGITEPFKGSGRASEFAQLIEEKQSVFEKIEDSVADIQSACDRAKAEDEKPSACINDMHEAVNRFLLGDGSAGDDFSNSLLQLEKSKDDLSRDLSEADRAADRYYENVTAGRSAAAELEAYLENARGDMSEDTYNILNTQMQKIHDLSGSGDFWNVEANKASVRKYSDELAGLDGLIDAAKYGLSSENAPAMQELTTVYKDRYSDFNMDDLGVNFEQAAVRKNNDDFLSSVTRFFRSGILRYVADDIPENKTDRDDFPSVSFQDLYGNAPADVSASSSDSLIFGEYVLTHFGNYLNRKEGSALECEAEYIITGKDSDEENLAGAVNGIVLIRNGLNLISLLADPDKMAQAELAAMALVGFTGVPVLIEIAKLVLCEAWALAESMSDVKALLAGGKVKTIKDPSDWTVSLTGLKNYSARMLTSSGNSEGLDYESYLRVLLLLQSPGTLYLRSLDMIQADMCLNENVSFRIRQCCCGISLQAEYEAPLMFVTLPFVKKNISGRALGITCSLDYDY